MTNANPKGALCVRCCAAPATIRAVCATCSNDLETMHWQQEYTLFGKVFYDPKLTGVAPSLDWMEAERYPVRKPPKPNKTLTPTAIDSGSKVRHAPNEALSL